MTTSEGFDMMPPMSKTETASSYETALDVVKKEHSPEDYDNRVWEELTIAEQEAALTKQLFME